MKAKLIGLLAVLSMVCATNASAVLDCTNWLATWDVELADGTSTVWDIAASGTPSFPIDCKVTGISTPAAGDPFTFQIMVISFEKTKFLYTEEMNVTQNSTYQELTLNAAMDAFTAATSGTYTAYPDIVRGSKRTEEPEPGECATIAPRSALPGETTDVAITVKNATLGTGATVAFDCSDIAVNSTAVKTPTEISVNITVADSAAGQTCAIAVSTPDQIITQGCTFTIGAAPVCIDADNDTYGENCPAGADCDDNSTDVNPGAEEVCDGIDNNCDGQVDEGGVCAPVCEIAGVAPATISTGAGLLPRVAFLTITGNEVADFSDSSMVSFDPADGIFTLFQSGSGDTLNVLVLIWGAAAGEVAITVDGCSGGLLELQ